MSIPNKLIVAASYYSRAYARTVLYLENYWLTPSDNSQNCNELNERELTFLRKLYESLEKSNSPQCYTLESYPAKKLL